MDSKVYYGSNDFSSLAVLEDNNTVTLSINQHLGGISDITLELDTLSDLIYHLQHVKYRMLQAARESTNE